MRGKSPGPSRSGIPEPGQGLGASYAAGPLLDAVLPYLGMSQRPECPERNISD
jgi:hypothetical protein